MKTAKITRQASDDLGTFGRLVTDRFDCVSLECPDRNNAPMVSCIPAGKYICELVQSPKFGSVYEVKNVPDRKHILIHSANWAGDEAKGYYTDLHGCIALGGLVANLKTPKGHVQKGVSSSKATLNAFMQLMGGEPFELTIV